jgi:hypothetical protein
MLAKRGASRPGTAKSWQARYDEIKTTFAKIPVNLIKPELNLCQIYYP